jgi:hypothetical protein
LQQLPITLTLKSGSNEINYPARTTDASGYFTVTAPSDVGSYPGSYRWRVKGPKYLANSGSMVLSDGTVATTTSTTRATTVHVEMGYMRVGDASNDNIINASDFNILRMSFGLSSGQQGYDERAEFNGDLVVNIGDFTLMRRNFGLGGAPPLNPWILLR